MTTRHHRWVKALLGFVVFTGIGGSAVAEESDMRNDTDRAWRQQAVEYARIMSRVKWTPVAGTMPNRKGGYFEEGTEYTGVPYSSVKSVGRYIGFEIYLKTFLAAVENPHSVLYSENLSGKVSNAATYYGKVCSSYTSYALQCAVWYVSRQYTPPYRDGVRLVDPQSAQAAAVGDIIFTPPAPGSHVEIVTDIARDGNGRVTHVRVEESRPPTTTNRNRTAETFDAHIAARDRKLYRITDLDAWREENRAERYRFPNYAEDAVTPEINRVLLLDRGDWVPYHRNQPVRINVMDRDSQGVRALVIKRGDAVVEQIPVRETGVIERTFSDCGDYTAHCVMVDGSTSRACEFAVCDLAVNVAAETLRLGEPWEFSFSSENMDVIIAYLNADANPYARYAVFVTEADRQDGRVRIPAELLQDTGNWQIWLMGENRYGRLKQQLDITVSE